MKVEKQKLILSTHVSIGNVDEARILVTDLLTQNKDHWDLWIIYFEIIDQSKLDWMRESEAFIRGLMCKKVRGPSLALLELFGKDCDRHEELCIDYFEDFGDLFSCFDDIKHMLSKSNNGLRVYFDESVKRLKDTNQVTKLLVALKSQQELSSRVFDYTFYEDIYRKLLTNGISSFLMKIDFNNM